MVAKNQIDVGSRVRAEVGADKESLVLRSTRAGEAPAPAHPTVLLVDDNRDLLQFLERLMAESGWELLAAESASEARKIVAKRKPNAALPVSYTHLRGTNRGSPFLLRCSGNGRAARGDEL